MKIVYTIAGIYRKAGMERILTDKANYLAGLGNEIVIVTTEQKGREEAFQLNASIRRYDLDIRYEDNNGRSLLLKLLSYPFKKIKHRKRLGKLLRDLQPDITISMFCGDETFLPRLKYGGRKIIEVHFSRFKRLQYGRTGFWALADRYRSSKDLKCILRYDTFVSLTEEDLEYWGHPANGVVIPNFISRFPDVTSNLESKVVLAVGRFEYQKGFDRLISAWELVCAELSANHGWELHIVGDGTQKETLLKQVDNLGLADTVVIQDSTIDMDSVYRNGSIYALSSRYEGLPMVLLEAQSYGIPIVAFECKCGPKDIVSNETGILVTDGDIKGLAEALVRLIRDEELRKGMGHKARIASAKWDREATMKLWIDLLSKR